MSNNPRRDFFEFLTDGVNMQSLLLGNDYPQQPRIVKLKAYSSIYLGNEKIPEGDKIVLHPSILSEIVNSLGDKELPQPIILHIENVKTHKISHCGVLEFSAKDNNAYLPYWMLESLFLQDGDYIQLTMHSMPKLKYIRFKPDQYRFTEIDPKATLEYCLTKFTALTEGDTISITTPIGLFSLHVMEVRTQFRDKPNVRQPNDEPCAGCLCDSTPEVDFEEPIEPPPTEDRYSVLVFDSIQKGSVTENTVDLYRLKILNDNKDNKFGILFELRALRGDPDLYIHSNVSHPTPLNNKWSLTTSNMIKELIIHPWEISNISVLYVAINGYKGAAEYELKVSEHIEEEKKEGYRTDANPSANDNAKQCSNCLKYVAITSFDMHYAFCSRHNWRCDKCGKVMLSKEKDSHYHCPECDETIAANELSKHIELKHKKVRCECGLELDPSVYTTHKNEGCSKRLVTCSYCQLQLPYSDKFRHENYCGGKTSLCSKCGQSILNREMESHLHIHEIHDENNGDMDIEDAELAAAIQMSLDASESNYEYKKRDKERDFKNTSHSIPLSNHPNVIEPDEQDNNILIEQVCPYCSSFRTTDVDALISHIENCPGVKGGNTSSYGTYQTCPYCNFSSLNSDIISQHINICKDSKSSSSYGYSYGRRLD